MSFSYLHCRLEFHVDSYKKKKSAFTLTPTVDTAGLMVVLNKYL